MGDLSAPGLLLTEGALIMKEQTNRLKELEKELKEVKTLITIVNAMMAYSRQEDRRARRAHLGRARGGRS